MYRITTSLLYIRTVPFISMLITCLRSLNCLPQTWRKLAVWPPISQSFTAQWTPSAVWSFSKIWQLLPRSRTACSINLIGAAWLPYIRPSARKDAIMKVYTQKGHCEVRKNHKWISSWCCCEGMINDIHQTLESCIFCWNHAGPNQIWTRYSFPSLVIPCGEYWH